MALIVGVIVAVPTLYGILLAPPGSAALGFPVNTDDHMVYAAWMRQAMDGHLLMDNRFAVDEQPGLTIHLYFFVLGLVAKLVGIPWAAHLARILLSVAFVFLLDGLVQRLTDNKYTAKLILALSVFAGGLGFLVWHYFGIAIVRPAAQPLAPFFGGLPVDVWQPEAFVFPSMLTSGLFMASLCLILLVFRAILDARESWSPVALGAVSLGLLMNIHSYDVLLVVLVLAGFLAMRVRSGDFTWAWLGRAAAIGAGAILPALWFVFVLRQDAVFQARAATETFSPNFRQLFMGFVLLMVPALLGLALGAAKKAAAFAGVGIYALIILALYGMAAGASQGYFLQAGGFALVLVGSILCATLLSSQNATRDLFVSWALVGLVAPYFPALFQRKLSMGLSLPWAVLAALGLSAAMVHRDRSTRNLVTVLVALVFGASSILWGIRIKRLTDGNVSSTTVHPVYLSRDLEGIIRVLNTDPERKIVLAMPGVSNPDKDAEGNALPDQFSTPIIPDWNPFLAGLAGAYAYAGHWSETPNYISRRNEATKFFLAQTTDEERREILRKVRPNYLVAPNRETFGSETFADVSQFGTVVIEGSQFELVRVDPSRF